MNRVTPTELIVFRVHARLIGLSLIPWTV